MLLVCGFSESNVVHSAIKRTFPDMTVIIPNETGLAVLKGAVIFGHNPSVIMFRVSRYTYGVDVINEFKSGLYPPEYKIYVTYVNKYKCKHIFEALVQSASIFQ